MQQTGTTSEVGSLNDSIRAACEKAMEVGATIDLTGCGYGNPHWKSNQEYITSPFQYYHFLAGFVRVNNVRTVMEIGTHCGGSIRSMIRGLASHISPEEANFVTMDLSYLNEEGFAAAPDSYIKRIQSDSSSPIALQRTIDYFAGGPIDLLYIDSDHSYEVTLPQIYSYGQALSPTWLILDDIHLNPSMDKLWDFLLANFGERCFDSSHVALRTNAGFGVVLIGG